MVCSDNQFNGCLRPEQKFGSVVVLLSWLMSVSGLVWLFFQAVQLFSLQYCEGKSSGPWHQKVNEAEASMSQERNPGIFAPAEILLGAKAECFII